MFCFVLFKQKRKNMRRSRKKLQGSLGHILTVCDEGLLIPYFMLKMCEALGISCIGLRAFGLLGVLVRYPDICVLLTLVFCSG